MLNTNRTTTGSSHQNSRRAYRHAGNSASLDQHNLLENIGSGVFNAVHRFHVADDVFVAAHPALFEGRDNNMAGGADYFIAQVFAKAGHDGDHHDQRHDPKGNAAYGNQGYQGNKILSFTGA